MKKRIIGAVLLAAAVCSGPALAGPPRANTSQKGSLLIFPLITVDPADSPGSSNTLIEISNDGLSSVEVKCFYVNENKGKVDFSFLLTAKATASWEVLTGTGNIAAPLFPFDSNPFDFGNRFKGELVCFAVNAGSLSQIAFNQLTGTATVVSLFDDDASQPHQAYRYNAWAFMARGVVGSPPVEGQIQGTPGDLQLTGANDGKSYDSCPAFNLANFVPGGAPASGGVRTIDNDLAVVSCNQDLKQDFKLHTTKLQFTVWNANENDFTGSFLCIDSVASTAIGTNGGDSTAAFTNPTNFDFSTLQTGNARFEVKGIFSSVCPVKFGTTENAGLLGVLTSSVAINGDADESQELGSTTFAAGQESGFVLWDPHGPTGVAKPK